MICNTFIEASYHMTSAPTHKLYSKKATKEAYMFIHGTGLDVVLRHYNLDYDPNELRRIFNGLFQA